MLQLIDIKKDYTVAGGTVHALKGININFRRNEFVSILGASGCGKTTLLNIVGGLDQYTSGDLIIDGVSTKQYKDREWDTYRNHSIGFIFQSYHLIPHQTILQNVELALTISGVSKQERRQRAIDALDKVGLKDKLRNRPNQLSGGQAQRVAIARALINDPEIVLADEPTGALDSKTSVQIMELLKEISKDRLVIMVTHNPELAEAYSTRIIRLLDGLVTDDSMPFGNEELLKEEAAQRAEREESGAYIDGGDGAGAVKTKVRTNKGSKKRTSMSPLMALSLSLKNLLSKAKRTAMVSIAGSIGIIGVSMVLAISAGVQNYIVDMEDDMLSGNPVSVQPSAIDFTSLMSISASSGTKVDVTKLKDKVYIKSLMETLGSFASDFARPNTITDAYVDYVSRMDSKYYNVLQYDYGFSLANNVYTDFSVDDTDNPADASATVSVAAMRGMYAQILSEQKDYEQFSSTISTVSTFNEIPNDYNYILSQYNIIAADTGSGVQLDASKLSDSDIEAIFNDKQSLIMVVSDREIADLIMGQFGYLTQEEFLNYAFKAVDSPMYNPDIGLVGSGTAEDKGNENGVKGFDITKFIGENSKTFTWYPNNEVFVSVQDCIDGWRAAGMPSAVVDNLAAKLEESNIEYLYRPYTQGNFFQNESMQIGGVNAQTGLDLNVKIILEKKSSVSYGCLSSGFYYTDALTDYVRNDDEYGAMHSDIVNHINTATDAQGNIKGYLDSIPYSFKYTRFAEGDAEEGEAPIVKSTVTGSSALYNSGGIMDMLMMGLGGDASSITHVEADFLGGASLPTAIYIYPKNFNTKDSITSYLDGWNKLCALSSTYTYTDADGVEQTVTLTEDDKINYTDNVGLIISMINTMIQMITIALVAFTSLSLVVSTVMIGIITYVSVVERVKEIGILRAVGARKADIKNLFNSETFIIGLIAGLFGILVTYLLSLIINIVVMSLAGIWGIAALPWWQAVIMVTLSVVLTLISGLIPASAAAKKDPVVALRTE